MGLHKIKFIRIAVLIEHKPICSSTTRNKYICNISDMRETWCFLTVNNHKFLHDILKSWNWKTILNYHNFNYARGKIEFSNISIENYVAE